MCAWLCARCATTARPWACPSRWAGACWRAGRLWSGRCGAVMCACLLEVPATLRFLPKLIISSPPTTPQAPHGRQPPPPCAAAPLQMPESRVPGVAAAPAVTGPVYLKYNSASGLCYCTQYEGRDRGVLVQLGQEQLGHLPLGLHDESMSGPPVAGLP